MALVHCRECGEMIAESAPTCPKCGASQRVSNSTPVTSNSINGEGKDWLTTMLLCLFLGVLGVHRFYTKHLGIGVLQLLTRGCCGIFTLIDLIMILMGSYKDADGNPLVKNN